MGRTVHGAGEGKGKVQKGIAKVRRGRAEEQDRCSWDYYEGQVKGRG